MGEKLSVDDVRSSVRETYAQVARQSENSSSTEAGCCSGSSCCAPEVATLQSAESVSVGLGYSQEDVTVIPDGANMGLGCGNPQAIAALKPGEVVVDLGCGGGFDAFLAAQQVGSDGQVIGVDMTPDMVSKARKNVAKSDFENIDIRLGEIEHLPVADSSVDVIISNCVINLSPEKAQVCIDAFRVLKPGGRLAISDIVATEPLPESVLNDLALISGCISGASTIDDHLTMLKAAGFADIVITERPESRAFIADWVPGSGLEEYVVSATIEARKA
ncbi:MAG: arsenite methyltransferase [Sedimenticola sp.]